MLVKIKFFITHGLCDQLGGFFQLIWFSLNMIDVGVSC